MLFLSVLAFLQGVAVGSDAPFVFLHDQRIFPQGIGGGAGPFIPNIESDFDLPVNGARVDPVESAATFSNELSFARWSSRVCKQGPPVVKYFARLFTEKIKAVEELRRAFVLKGFTAETLSSRIYGDILYGQTRIGNPNAQESATVVARAARENFHKVKDDSLILIQANLAAKYLFYRGVLNASNALSLVQQYFEKTKRSILSLRSTPLANMRAVGIGFDEFVTSLGLFDEYSGLMTAAMFSSEWYALDADKPSVCQSSGICRSK